MSTQDDELDSRLMAAADSLAYLRCAMHAEAVRDGVANLRALRARAERIETLHTSAADADKRLDTAEAEVVALREALRKEVVVRIDVMDPKPQAVYHCTLCDGLWDHGEPESHLAGCLAEQIEKDKGG